MDKSKKSDMAIWNEGEVADGFELTEITGVSGEELEDGAGEAAEMVASDESDVEMEAESEVGAEAADEAESESAAGAMEGTELEDFESAEIEDVEFVSDDQLASIIESVFFSTDKPVSIAFLRQVFRGTNIRSKEIRKAVEEFASELADNRRGVTLEEVSGGYQLRTKIDNVKFLRASIKARPFKLSGPALEVLSIVAYKQPVTKAQMDEIRGVESGHLLRALMEKNLVGFGDKSELPGKPMYYETTRKFLEIFGLRNVRELPSLHEIDQLIPEGIGESDKKETLGDLTEKLSEATTGSYSQGEEELLRITDELSHITTTSEFFEQEKQRMRDKRDQERAQDIREAIALGETVEEKDLRWLERYDQGQLEKAKGAEEAIFVAEESAADPEPEATP